MKYVDALRAANDLVDAMLVKPSNGRGFPVDSYPVPKTWAERYDAVKEIADRLVTDAGLDAMAESDRQPDDEKMPVTLEHLTREIQNADRLYVNRSPHAKVSLSAERVGFIATELLSLFGWPTEEQARAALPLPYGRLDGFLDSLSDFIELAENEYDSAPVNMKLSTFLAQEIREKMPRLGYVLPSLTELTDWILDGESLIGDPGREDAVRLANRILGKMQGK